MKQVAFKGTGNEYFNIWIVNILLCIVTLGIYYPWAKARNRRYFYANTVYEGRNFEYHATGKQLFLGYAIGVGLLILMSVLNSVFPSSNLITPIILFIGVPWVIWRSLKFNARMTSFSNVRFGFDGSLGQAYFNYLLLPILGFLAFYLPIILGFVPMFLDTEIGIPAWVKVFAPFVAILAVVLSIYVAGFTKKKITDYAIGKAKFGQGSFNTNVTTKEFIFILLKAGLVVFAVFVVLAILAGIIFGLIMGGSMVTDMSTLNPEVMAENMAGEVNPLVGLLVPLLYLGFIAASLFVRAYFYSRNRRYIYANTQLDNKIDFKSTVGAKSYFWVIFSNFLITIFTLGFGRPWAKVREAKYLAQNTWIEATDTDIDSYLTQKQAEQSAIGEEIGDVFDVDVGIGL